MKTSLVKNKITAPRLLTTTEAADYLHVSSVTLWRLRNSGELAASRIRGKVLFEQKDLDNLLAKGREGAK